MKNRVTCIGEMDLLDVVLDGISRRFSLLELGFSHVLERACFGFEPAEDFSFALKFLRKKP